MGNNMKLQDELRRVQWESTRQKAIKALESLKPLQHFIALTVDHENKDAHDYKYMYASGCTGWMLGAGIAIIEHEVTDGGASSHEHLN